ncbi:MAG: iron ABC transporter permease [Thermoproteota archaeon]
MAKGSEVTVENLALIFSLAILIFLYFYPFFLLFFSVKLKDVVSTAFDPYIQELFVGTLIQALLSTIPTLLLSLPVAFFLSRYEFKFSRELSYLLLTPFFMPSFATAEAFIILFGNNGFFNFIVKLIFGSNTNFQVLYSMNAVILAHIFYYLPLSSLILQQGFSSIDKDLEEAARVASANWFLMVRSIYIPQLLPSFTASLALVFIFSFISYSTPLLLGGKFTTVEVEIFSTRTQSSSLNLAFLQALVTIFFALMLIVYREKFYFKSLSYRKTEKKKLSFSNLSPSEIFLLLIFAIIVFVEIIPVYIVVVQAFSKVPVFILPTNISLENFLKLFNFDFGFGLSFIKVLLYSLSIAFIVSFVSTSLSLVFVFSYIRNEKLRRIFSSFFFFPLSISQTSFAMSLMVAYGLSSIKLYGTWYLIAIGQISVIIPLTVRIIELSWLKISDEIYEASMVSGASRLTCFLNLELPSIYPSLVSSFLISISSSLSEFTFSNFFSTFNIMTMPAAVYELIASRNLGLASSLTSLIVVSVIISELLVSKFLGTEFKVL